MYHYLVQQRQNVECTKHTKKQLKEIHLIFPTSGYNKNGKSMANILGLFKCIRKPIYFIQQNPKINKMQMNNN
jgi:hypothetical protein